MIHAASAETNKRLPLRPVNRIQNDGFTLMGPAAIGGAEGAAVEGVDVEGNVSAGASGVAWEVVSDDVSGVGDDDVSVIQSAYKGSRGFCFYSIQR